MWRSNGYFQVIDVRNRSTCIAVEIDIKSTYGICLSYIMDKPVNPKEDELKVQTKAHLVYSESRNYGLGELLVPKA